MRAIWGAERGTGRTRRSFARRWDLFILALTSPPRLRDRHAPAGPRSPTVGMTTGRSLFARWVGAAVLMIVVVVCDPVRSRPESATHRHVSRLS